MRLISVTYAKAKVMAVYFAHEILDGGYWEPNQPGYHADTSTSEVVLATASLRTWRWGINPQYPEGAANTKDRLASSMNDKQCIIEYADREKAGQKRETWGCFQALDEVVFIIYDRLGRQAENVFLTIFLAWGSRSRGCQVNDARITRGHQESMH